MSRDEISGSAALAGGAALDGAALRFSVIVPTHQRRSEVVALIEALALQRASDPFEVLVVVDGSSDGTAEALRRMTPSFPLSVVEQRNLGAAAARNAGAARSRGEILLFLDDDMEPAADLLARHDHRHRQGADAVVGHMPVHPDSPRSFLTEATEGWVAHRTGELQRGETVPGELVLTGQLSVARRWFEALGGFDESFTRGGSYGGEDTDFGLRLESAGARIVFEPKAVSHQRQQMELGPYLWRYRDVGRAFVQLLRKHPDLPQHVVRVGLRQSRFDRWVGNWLYPMIERPILGLLSRGVRHRRLERFFFRHLRGRHYWRGVRESGGYPVPRPVRVLAYHAIRELDPRSPAHGFAVPAARLRQQLALLRRFGFRFVRPSELERLLHAGGGVPKGAVLLTFDDAYADLAREGLPILSENGAAAVAFVVTGQIGGHNAWDVPNGVERLPLCSHDDLRELCDHGLLLGSHSRTHAALDVADANELVEELDGSAADLEAAGFARPRWFAYPYGRTSERARAAAVSAGYRLAFEIAPGIVTPASDPCRLPRIEVRRGDRGLGFLIKVLVAGRWPRRRERRFRRPRAKG